MPKKFFCRAGRSTQRPVPLGKQSFAARKDIGEAMSEKDENALVVVFDAADAVEALLYRSLLEEAGIDVEERIFEARLV